MTFSLSLSNSSYKDQLINVERGRPPRSDPVESDLQSFKTVQDWYARGSKVTIPEAEFRQMLATDESGHPTMTRRSLRFVGQAIREGDGRFTDIRGPVLAIFAVANDPGKVDTNDPAAVEAANAYVEVQTARTKRRASAFQRGVPQARVVLIDRADHYVFLSNQAEVIRELRDFISTLGP
jgi:pimeloyl-ACP methyl ester carboxylesterase